MRAHSSGKSGSGASSIRYCSSVLVTMLTEMRRLLSTPAAHATNQQDIDHSCMPACQACLEALLTKLLCTDHSSSLSLPKQVHYAKPLACFHSDLIKSDDRQNVKRKGKKERKRKKGGGEWWHNCSSSRRKAWLSNQLGGLATIDTPFQMNESE